MHPSFLSNGLEKQDQIQLMPKHTMKILLLLVTCVAQFMPSHSAALPADCKLNGKILDCSHLYSFPNGSFADVEVVNFSDNNFTALTYRIFHKHGFRRMKMAILRYNQIGRVDPKAFIMMAEVEQLDLYGNGLSKLSKNSLNGLTSLTSLCLASNRITSIDADIFNPTKTLDSLDLSNNSITQLPRDLLKHGFVTQLDLSENPLVFYSNDSILKSFYLNQLFLRSCNLEKLPAEAFSQLPKLQSLDLSRNKLRIIAEDLFDPLVELQHLDISHNFISQLEPQMFALTRLRQINCAGNPGQTDTGCDDFLMTTTTVPCTMKGFKSMSWNYTENEQNGGNSTSGGVAQKDSKFSVDKHPNVSHVTPESTRNYSEEDNSIAVLNWIFFVGVMCLIVLVVLVGQIFYYFKCIMPQSNNVHTYEEISANV